MGVTDGTRPRDARGRLPHGRDPRALDVPLAGEQTRHDVVEQPERHSPQDVLADRDAVDDEAVRERADVNSSSRRTSPHARARRRAASAHRRPRPRWVARARRRGCARGTGAPRSAWGRCAPARAPRARRPRPARGRSPPPPPGARSQPGSGRRGRPARRERRAARRAAPIRAHDQHDPQLLEHIAKDRHEHGCYPGTVVVEADGNFFSSIARRPGDNSDSSSTWNPSRS